jgi:energy-coupling factor transporter ATP-binding protein EcfA2
MNYFNRTRSKTIFPHGYSKLFYDFWWSHRALWESWIGRLKIEKDCFVLITGDTGSGKSVFTGTLCFKHARKEANFILNDGTTMFEANDNFIIDPDEFAYKMITKEGQVLWLDEARRVANRRKWFSKINNAVADRKNQNRKLFNIYLLCMPFEKEFDPALGSHLTMWIWVRRGVGEVYCKRSGVKGGTGLNIQAILERESKYLKEDPARTIVNPTIHPEYVGRIAFRDFSAKLKQEYGDLVRKKKATGDLTDEEKKKYGVVVDKTPENIVQGAIEKIGKGKIKDKKALWNELSIIKIPDDKKLKMLNFYLKIEGFDTFSKLFNKSKLETANIDW